ncbi:ribosome-associated translation inhibitor RaiA [Fructilactobacillus vespulae]|uniref:ribosome hibernation-promoting factor, HPF/YfiA family n=1 Tax=Fructilactobacillus vespulae TaxID=1249630 RepID=UPI0039B61EA5
MLSFNIRGDDVEITDDLRNYVAEQMEQINRYFESDVNAVAHVNLFGFKNQDVKSEITIIFPFVLVRGEATASDYATSVKATIKKIKKQIDKYQGRINEQAKRNGNNKLFKETPTDTVQFKIKRKKRVPLKQMTSDEAILRMNLLDHDFYTFKDIDNETIDIVYRRKDGNYGLIVTES